MTFFSNYEFSYTSDSLDISNYSFINIDDIHIIDGKFETLINSDPNDFSKIPFEEFDPEATWDASEGEAEALGLQIDEILQNEENFNDFTIFDEIVDEEEVEKNLSEFLDFKKKSKPKGLKPYSCTVCNFNTNNRYYFHQHFRTAKHQKRALKSKIIKNDEIIIKVLDDSSETQNFECEDCGIIFPKKKQLNDHIRECHLTHKCDKCNRRFRDEKEFNLHRQRHSKASDFECRRCPKKFTNNQNLKRHERTHTEAKRFVCNICEKNFGQKTNLLRHLKVHQKIL